MKFAKVGMVLGLGLLAFTTVHPRAACGATIRDDVPDSGYLALGADAAFASVGLLTGGLYTGCGILIAPNWVLTAAHMLDFSSSATFTLNGTAYTSTELYRNPGWNGDVLNGNDFGLVHFTSSLTAIPPAQFYAGPTETNLTGTFVGYGFTGTGLTGWKTLDGRKRAFQNTIDGDFDLPTLLLGADFDNPGNAADSLFGSATPLPLEGCVAPGDSGGGVFVQQGGQYYLAGVISGVLATDGNPNSDYGDITAYGRIAGALPWINSIVSVPEPAAGALLLAAGLAMLGYRRGKK